MASTANTEVGTPVPTLEDITDAMRQGRMAQMKIIEMEADLVVALVKAAGVLTVMPNAMLPLAPPLLIIHPDVYQRVNQKVSTRGSGMD